MSKADYIEYINGDGYDNFQSFLGIVPPVLEYGTSYCGGEGMVRYTSPRGTGEWCRTQKEAKSSYKEDMYKRKAEQRKWKSLYK